MLLAGIFGFAIYFVQSSLQILMVSCMFSLMIGTANFVISSIVVDIFPTHVGAVAICMMTCFGRIGAIASNLTFGMLLDISCEVPIFLVGSIVICKFFFNYFIILFVNVDNNKFVKNKIFLHFSMYNLLSF